MERIKQAIEKARRERGTQHAPSERARTAAPPRSGDNELVDLRYQQTRIESLDPVHLREHRIVAFEKTNASTPFDMLRTQILQVMGENGWRTVAITSPTPEAGKTVVSINLALSIAQQTTRTALLVDFDLRRPRIASYLGLRAHVSLNEALSGKALLEDALVNPGIPRFVVLPTHRPVSHSAELLGSPAVQALVSDIRQRYDSRIAIFDLPPLLSTDDALAILPSLDCVVLVVGNGLSTRREIESSLALLRDNHLAGVVMNKADDPSRPYYYY